MRSERGAAGLLVLAASILLAGLAACSNNRSFVVVHLRSDAEGVSFTDIQRIDVTVSQNGGPTKSLSYDADGITIDFTTENDLSLNFSPEQSGAVTLTIDAIDGKDCTVAHATTTAVLRKGGTAQVTAKLFAFNSCTPRDGGPPPADGAVLPGCDPSGTACGAGKTCQVKCSSNPPLNECTPAGTGTHGATCKTNADCEPGAQCFKYASPNCSVSVCLRYCADQAQCEPAPADGGAADAGIGTRSLCVGPVQCGSLLTAYHTCSFGCDPRESALAANRCPAGLSCLMVGDMDQVDCACPEPSRVGTDGADCTGGAVCAPGFICNMMGGVKKCRAVCRCDASNGFCSAPNDCRASGKTCHVLASDTKFGVCL
jgi:hypothetical protein